MTGTHQFVQHDQQTDTSEIDGVSVSGDDKLTHSLRLETGPSSATRDAIGKSACRQRQRAVDDGNVCVRLRSDVVEATANLSLERRLRGRRVEDLRARDLDGRAVLVAAGVAQWDEHGGGWGETYRDRASLQKHTPR